MKGEDFLRQAEIVKKVGRTLIPKDVSIFAGGRNSKPAKTEDLQGQRVTKRSKGVDRCGKGKVQKAVIHAGQDGV